MKGIAQSATMPSYKSTAPYQRERTWVYIDGKQRRTVGSAFEYRFFAAEFKLVEVALFVSGIESCFIEEFAEGTGLSLRL